MNINLDIHLEVTLARQVGHSTVNICFILSPTHFCLERFEIWGSSNPKGSPSRLLFVLREILLHTLPWD